MASTPRFAKRVLASADCMIFTSSVLMRAMRSLAVPVGTRMPHQLSSAKPGTPDSATVGYSGISGVRLAPVTAIARRRPLLTCGIAGGASLNTSCTWPAIKSFTDSTVPLYGTCVICTPVSVLNNSPARCAGEPAPPEPKFRLDGLALASAIMSCTDFTGTFGFTTSTFGPAATSDTP